MASKLDYLLSEEWNSKVKGLDLSTADESALRYDAFMGDIIFQIGDADFSLDWGWIPILDFAACLVNISDEILRGSEYEAFDFTESDAEIIFKCAEGNVIVSATYTDVKASINISDLAELTHTFFRKVKEELTLNYPEIGKNPAFRKIVEQSSSS
ncbi:MAG: hypothetical protein AAF065_03855 [Verrucomicrobiota bacterium]